MKESQAEHGRFAVSAQLKVRLLLKEQRKSQSGCNYA